MTQFPPAGNMPGGWGGGPSGTIFIDDKIVHGGRWALRIERNAKSLNDFSTVTKSIEMDFSGASLELRAFCVPKTLVISPDYGCAKMVSPPRLLLTTCRAAN